MLETIYNQTVTILNKVQRTDSPTGLDTWHKHIIKDVAWYTKSARSAGGSTVFIGTYITVLIPFHDDFRPYPEWKTMSDKDDYFTISTGDYIILGEINETEITPANVVAVTNKYGENVCTVKHHMTNYNRYGAKIQLKIEGV